MPVHCGHSDNVVIKDIPQPMFVTSLDSSLVPDVSCLLAVIFWLFGFIL